MVIYIDNHLYYIIPEKDVNLLDILFT